MNILYCGDQGIARGVLVSILSLLINGQKQYNPNRGEMIASTGVEPPIYNIYIMTVRYPGVKPFRQETADFLNQLVKKYNSKNRVKLIDATKAFEANPPDKNMGTYFTPCAMLRLYIDQIPEFADIDKLLYLDYDIVCRGDIRPLYNIDISSQEAAGVLDLYGRRWYKYHGLFKRSKDAKDWLDPKDRPRSFFKQDYMNSGVMLFNLTKCRQTKMLERARALCASKKMLLPDQGALNLAITHRLLLPRKFNEQDERPRPETILHHFSNNFKFWPYFRVQKVKPFEVAKIHRVLKIHEYDDILELYNSLKSKL